MREHFPFWLPLLTTVALAGVFAAWNFGIDHYTSMNFEGAERHHRECRVATEMAAASIPGFAAMNAARAKANLAQLPIVFRPVLHGISIEGGEATFPHYVSANLRTLLLIVPPLDCSQAFGQRGLSIMRHPPSWNDQGPTAIRVSFSRIVFSQDGRRAFVEKGESCGGLCGPIYSTTWRLNDGKWTLDKSIQIGSF